MKELPNGFTDLLAEQYDVVICGGGVAGLGMARQIQRRRPHSSVLVLDRAPGPSPESAHKVGESIPEGGAYYLRHVLGLGDYLATRHLPKFGLRFFYGGGAIPFEDRLEYGGLQWPPIATYQLDRGILENDLRALVIEGGATVLTECEVVDVVLSEDGGPHQITARHNGSTLSVRGRWVIDTTGRRRLLARKLGHTMPIDYPVSACWWRTDRPVRVDDFVDAANRDWHERGGQPRWYSTNHLVGDGYWIWLIPLAPGRTSVGIMADENRHPLRERSTYDSARAWLRRHEPRLAEELEQCTAVDFNARKNFAYTTGQAFSHHRWACFGDAAVLTDALYSFGQEMIANAAMMIMRLIDLDDRGGLTEQSVARYDRGYRKLFDIVHHQFPTAYACFGHPFVASQKVIWDSYLYFAVLQQLVMQNTYDLDEGSDILNELVDRLEPLNRAMQALFREFRNADPHHLAVDQGMRSWSPRAHMLAEEALNKRPPEQLPEFFRARLKVLEEIAATVFTRIVEHSDAVPHAARERLLRHEHGVNPTAVSLCSERWDADGLFDHRRPAVDLDNPLEMDAQDRREAELAAFVPLPEAFRRAAAGYGEDTAVLEVDPATGHTGRIGYHELLTRVDRATELAAGLAGGEIGVGTTGAVDTLTTLLGVQSTGRAARIVDPSRAEKVPVISGIWPELTVTTGPVGGTEPPAVRDERIRLAWIEERVAGGETHLVRWDMGAQFRMQGWLSRVLVGPAAGGSTRPRCLWLGPVRPELAVVLALGCPTVLIAATPPGTSLTGLIEQHQPEVVLTEPDQLRALVADDWTGPSVRLFTVGGDLPHELVGPLRTRAAQVYDFGYLTLAH